MLQNKYKTLKKIAELHAAIEKLDAQIIAVEAMAEKVAKGTLGVKVTLQVDVEPEEKKESPKKQMLGIYEMMRREMDASYAWMVPDVEQKKEESSVNFTEWISEPSAIRMLGFIAEDKKAKRAILEKRIEHLISEMLVDKIENLTIKKHGTAYELSGEDGREAGQGDAD